MRGAGVGLVLEALAAADVPRDRQPAALRKVAEVQRRNAAQVTRVACAAAASAGEAFVAELHAEADAFDSVAKQIEGQLERDRLQREAEAGAPELAAIPGGKPS
jgi:hypothetical protein